MQCTRHYAIYTMCIMYFAQQLINKLNTPILASRGGQGHLWFSPNFDILGAKITFVFSQIFVCALFDGLKWVKN